jgi:NADPH:quinone reductase-like Zn-dependent oxidoreductase
MKAIGVESFGQLSNLKSIDLPVPEPEAGQIRVQVHASSVNPADLKIVRGETAGRFLHSRKLPLVPGYDLSGVIDAVGTGVNDLTTGDAVFGHLAYDTTTSQGAFAERVSIDAAAVAKKPDQVEHTTAAAGATVGLTALQALREHARKSQGARILILGASGGVGSLAVAIAKRLGNHVTAVTSTPALDLVRELGADETIDRKRQNPFEHDRPFDVVFDTTGKYPYGPLKKLLAPSGNFVTTLPSPSFALAKLDTLFSSRRAKLVVVKPRRADLEELAAWFSDGLRVPIAQRFSVRDAATALARLDTGGVLGKIAVDVIDSF